MLDQAELAAYLGVPPSEVKQTLQSRGWHFHEDATGQLWATVPDHGSSTTDRPIGGGTGC